MIVDSHCHLDFPDLAQRLPEVLQRMQDNDVGVAVCIGVNLDDFPRVLALAEQDQRLYATVGVHPEYTEVEEPDVARLLALAAHPKVIAIGETGLDYYWQKDKPGRAARAFPHPHPRCPRLRQAAGGAYPRVGRGYAAGAARGGCRDGRRGDALLYRKLGDRPRSALDLGFYLSFSGIVTFKNATVVKDVASRCPLDRLLVETDAPYLAPVPYRGKPNEPAYVRYVAEEIARLRGLPADELIAASTDNFFTLFSPARRPAK